jgi:hypothetical protein
MGRSGSGAISAVRAHRSLSHRVVHAAFDVAGPLFRPDHVGVEPPAFALEARTLGLAVPLTMQMTADEVIE